MEHFEINALHTSNIQPKVFKRYVDDGFDVLQHGICTQVLLTYKFHSPKD